MPHTVFFHEDDYCQIELLPVNNRQHCLAQLGQISEFAEAHQSENGAGWTDMLVRSEEPQPLKQQGLTLAQVCSRLDRQLPRFDEVSTGYSSYRQACSNVEAFGFDEECVVFCSSTADGIVDHLWLGLCAPNPSQSAALVEALLALNEATPLLLVDWGWEYLIAVQDRTSLEDYLRERDRVFNAER